MARSRQDKHTAFVYGLVGTLVGGLLLTGLLALIRYLADVDLSLLLPLAALTAVGIGAIVSLWNLERGAQRAVTWASRVDARLDALEAKANIRSDEGADGLGSDASE